jgi:hypothetical protein
MAIKIVVSDTVGFKVKGAINDAAGVAQPFDFGLTCSRLDADQIQAKLAPGSDDRTISDFMGELITGWSGVRDPDNKEVPYSIEALRELFKIPGVAGLTLRTYIAEVGAKEKN